MLKDTLDKMLDLTEIDRDFWATVRDEQAIYFRLPKLAELIYCEHNTEGEPYDGTRSKDKH